MKLKIELVPQSSWGNNLRSEGNIPRAEWDRLRKSCYARADHKCEVCGKVSWRRYNGKAKPIVECHEVWSYNEERRVQKLEGLIALCSLCHKAKHLGRTLTVDKDKDRVLEHLMKVNDLDEKSLERLILDVFSLWERRSLQEWTLDLSWLERAQDWKAPESNR
jgi:5-methylcytosine-specific restriction endonuclease McrA